MRFEKILVPTDFSDASHRALEYALELAQKLGAQVSVVHVSSLPTYQVPDGSYFPTAEVVASVESSAQRQLDALAGQLKARGVTVATAQRTGRAPDEICDMAREIGAGLIVMGTHGRGLLERTLLGSVTQSVLRIAPIPVLTVRLAED